MSQPAPASEMPARAWRSPWAWAALLIVFALGLTADLVSKDLAFEHVASTPVELDREHILANPTYHPPRHRPVSVIGNGILNLQLVVNRGAVFGIGANRRVFFVSFTLVALAAGVLVFARWTSIADRLAHIAIGLVLAGGVGNLYDRIQFGVVRDFLHMFPGRHLPFGWTWPRSGNPELFPWVFNIADTLLLLGMALLLIHLNLVERQRRLAAEAEAGEAPTDARTAPGETAPDG